MKIGLLGAGGMGRVHARHYARMKDVHLSIFDRDSERAVALAESTGASVAASYESLLNEVDALDICLPTPLHVEAALQAVAAGKPVIVEKPLVKTLEEGKKLVEAAEAANVPLMVGQVVRFFPEYAAGNRMVKSGAVGKPAAVRMRRGGKAPLGSEGWFQDLEKSGGVLLDLAIHEFDWLRWTFGEVDHLYSRSVGFQDGHGPDYALTTLTFDSGVVAHVEATWMDPAGFRTQFEVAGSEGLIEHDSRHNIFLRTATEDGIAMDGGLAPDDDPYFLELAAFVAGVKGEAPIPVTGRDGLNALSISLAAIESAKTGQVVRPERF